MNSKTWKDINLKLEIIDDKLYVQQNGKEYMAQGFPLNNDLCEIIDVAAQHGIGCLLRTTGGGHPLSDKWKGGGKYEDGSHSIPFSRSDNSMWIFALQWMKRKKEIRIYFEKRYQYILLDSGLGPDLNFEKGGGGNIIVTNVEFMQVINYLDEGLMNSIK